MVTIEDGTKHLEEIAKLFEEYKNFLGLDVSFQPADATAEEIAKRYGGDGGRLYIAFVDEEAAGCIAFHPMNDRCDCELKRLFTRPAFRGHHVGKLLMQRALDEARALGYRRAYLDTVKQLGVANIMYHRMGFREIPAYYHNPLPDVVYYCIDLADEKKTNAMGLAG